MGLRLQAGSSGRANFALGESSGRYLCYLQMINSGIQLTPVLEYTQGRQSVPKSGRSKRGEERNFGVAPKNFCPNFRGGAEKVVVHMHWLTWLLWRHWTFRYISSPFKGLLGVFGWILITYDFVLINKPGFVIFQILGFSRVEPGFSLFLAKLLIQHFQISFCTGSIICTSES